MCQLPPDSQLASWSQVWLVAASALLSDEETGAATAAAAVTATATLRTGRELLRARWRGAWAINQPLGRLRSELSGSGGKVSPGSSTVTSCHCRRASPQDASGGVAILTVQVTLPLTPNYTGPPLLPLDSCGRSRRV